MTVRVVVVEESPTQLAALVKALRHGGEVDVVATAQDAAAAVAAVAEHRPAVVTMDLGIPGGGGTAAIRRIMHEHPVPVLVLSGHIDGRSTALAVEALAAGAVDAAPKPVAWDHAGAAQLVRRVCRVASVPVVRIRASPPPGVALPPAPQPGGPVPRAIAVAASTGGPAALEAFLAPLRGVPIPVLAVQHIHASFAGGLAAWLFQSTGWRSEVARDGGIPEAGTIHIAPGDRHMTLAPDGRIALRREPADALHRPSADVLLRSVAERLGSAAIGVVLTGMGEDGTRGLLAIRDAGGLALAQDERSCVVFGMPRAARDAGATTLLLPPDGLAAAVRAHVGIRR